MQGKTKSGFAYDVDKECLEDAEFLELYSTVSNGEDLRVFDLIEKLLGKEQKARLYDHVRNDKGRVPIGKLTDEAVDILTALGEDAETKK